MSWRLVTETVGHITSTVKSRKNLMHLHDLLFLLLSFLHSSSIQGPAYYKKVLPTATESALISVIKMTPHRCVHLDLLNFFSVGSSWQFELTGADPNIFGSGVFQSQKAEHLWMDGQVGGNLEEGSKMSPSL